MIRCLLLALQNTWATKETQITLSQVTKHFWSLDLNLELGEDLMLWLCLGVYYFSLVLNEEVGMLGWLEWWWLGGIYSPNQHSSCCLSSLFMGTPDSPVARMDGCFWANILVVFEIPHPFPPVSYTHLTALETVWESRWAPDQKRKNWIYQWWEILNEAEKAFEISDDW